MGLSGCLAGNISSPRRLLGGDSLFFPQLYVVEQVEHLVTLANSYPCGGDDNQKSCQEGCEAHLTGAGS